MALPQQAIERLTRKPQPATSWHSQLLMFGSILFFISLGLYLGLDYGYKPYLDSQNKKLNDQIQEFANKVPEADQQMIIKFYSQLANLRILLKGHISTSQVFGWLERNTIQNIYYTKFSLNVPNQQASVSGVARTVQDLAQELQLLSSLPEVTRVTFNNLSAVQNGFWQFDMVIVFDKEIFMTSQTMIVDSGLGNDIGSQTVNDGSQGLLQSGTGQGISN
jgi:hypothetical protein